MIWPFPTAMRATFGVGNTRDSPTNISISGIWPSSSDFWIGAYGTFLPTLRLTRARMISP